MWRPLIISPRAVLRLASVGAAAFLAPLLYGCFADIPDGLLFVMVVLAPLLGVLSLSAAFSLLYSRSLPWSAVVVALLGVVLISFVYFRFLAGVRDEASGDIVSSRWFIQVALGAILVACSVVMVAHASRRRSVSVRASLMRSSWSAVAGGLAIALLVLPGPSLGLSISAFLLAVSERPSRARVSQTGGSVEAQ